MIYIVIFSWKINFNQLGKKSEGDIVFKNFDKAWIISFIIFFLIHVLDITYFDGRISTISWILLSGMVCIIKSKKGLIRPNQV
jgi:L-asparagine transporter-like permease